MYREEPKPITNHFELKDVCRSAGLWYVGSFISNLIIQGGILFLGIYTVNISTQKTVYFL